MPKTVNMTRDMSKFSGYFLSDGTLKNDILKKDEIVSWALTMKNKKFNPTSNSETFVDSYNDFSVIMVMPSGRKILVSFEEIIASDIINLYWLKQNNIPSKSDYRDPPPESKIKSINNNYYAPTIAQLIRINRKVLSRRQIIKDTLTINNVRLDLGHEILNMLSYSLDDNKKTMDIAHELAQSPCCETRYHIASRRCLHKKTVTKLLLDTQIEVMRAMIENDTFLSHMMLVDIERFIDADDPEVLTGIVNAMTDLTKKYKVCERDWLCEQLFQHPDPGVRFVLAGNEATPVFFLGNLAQDPDLDVSQVAIETLENIALGDDIDF